MSKHVFVKYTLPLLFVCISQVPTLWASGAEAALEEQTMFLIEEHFSKIDTLLERAAEEQIPIPGLSQQVVTVLESLKAQASARQLLQAVKHFNKKAAAYPEPQELFNTLLLWFEDYPFDRHHIHDQASLLTELMMFDIRISDHRTLLQRVKTVQALNQDSISLEVKANVAYKLGYVEFYNDHFEAAAEAFENCSFFAKADGNIKLEMASADASVSCYYELGNYEKALSVARTTIHRTKEHFQQTGDELLNVNLLLNYSEALQKNGFKSSAYDTVTYAYHKALAGKDNNEIGRALYTIGRMHFFDEDYSIAISQLEQALEIFERLDDIYLSVSTMTTLSKAYAGEGDFVSAYKMNTLLATLKDSLQKANEDATVAQLLASQQARAKQYEIDLLQARGAQLEAENDRQRLQKIGLGLGLIVVLIIFGVVAYRLLLRRRMHSQLQAMVDERTKKLYQHAKQLEQSNVELERFAYIASHDLKTPLRNVTSFLGLIERRLPPSAKQSVQEYLDIATENAKQMHHLVTDVLEFSKINADIASQCTRFGLAERTRELITRMGPQLKQRNGVIQLHGHAEIVAPESYIMQLVSNLIENGLKYNTSAVPCVHVKLQQRAGYVNISIRDNGIGIAPEYHDRVFQLFKRLHTSDVYKGTGLGLAVCKKVVERLGGNIRLTSESGQGSTFNIVLPEDCRDVLGKLTAADMQPAELPVLS